MIIKNLHIVKFGALRNFDLDLSDGVNIIRGQNESGKSTAADFVCFMLYGSSGIDEKTKRLPFFEDACGGTLTLLDDKNNEYVVTRVENVSATRKKDVILTKNGTKVPVDGTPGKMLFGIPTAALFTSTVFAGQSKREVAEGTSSAVENLLFSGDENVSAAAAVNSLDKLRKELRFLKGTGGKISEAEMRYADLQSELYDATEAKRLAAEKRERSLAYRAQVDEVRKLRGEANENERLWKILKRRREENEILNEENRVNALENEWQEYETLHSRHDKFPTMHDYNIMYEAYSELRSQTADFENAKAKYAVSVREKNEAEEALRSARELNGEKIAVHEKKRGIFGTLGVAAPIAAILVFVLGFVFMFADKNIAAAAVFIALGIVLIGCTFAFMRAAQNHTNAAYDLRDTPDELERVRSCEEKCGWALDAAEEEKKKMEDQAEKCRGLADEWGVSGDTGPADLYEIISEGKKLSGTLAMSREDYIRHKLAFQTELNSDERLRDDGSEIILPPGYSDRTFAETVDELTDRERAILSEKSKVDADIVSLTARHRECAEIMEEMNELKAELDTMKKKFGAIELAKAMITEASAEMRRSISPCLARSAGKYCSAITDGKYSELGVSPSFDLTFNPDDGNGGRVTKDRKYMSGGTAAAAYISLRIALADLISEEERVPMILDEAFNYLDDGRLAGCLGILAGCGRQIIAFTSGTREENIAERIGIPFRKEVIV